jgi:hypothetical protein
VRAPLLRQRRITLAHHDKRLHAGLLRSGHLSRVIAQEQPLAGLQPLRRGRSADLLIASGLRLGAGVDGVEVAAEQRAQVGVGQRVGVLEEQLLGGDAAGRVDGDGDAGGVPGGQARGDVRE